jgi:Zn-finger protein
LRQEKRNLQPQRAEKEAEVGDAIDYPSLVEKFIEDQSILEFISKIRTSSLAECRQCVVDHLEEFYIIRKTLLANEPKLKEEIASRDQLISKLEAKLEKTKLSFEKKIALLSKVLRE